MTDRKRHPAGAPASTGGRFATEPAPAAASELAAEQPSRSRAQEQLDELATALAFYEGGSEINELAADCIGAAGLGLPHPGDQTDDGLEFWRAYEPDAEQGTPERALQEIGKHLGSHHRWPSGGDLHEFYVEQARAGGGEPNASEEEPEDALRRIDAELDRIGDSNPTECLILSAGALARHVRNVEPRAAVIEVSNGLAADGEMKLEVDAIYDADGNVLVSYVEDPGSMEPALEDYAMQLDRDFETLRAESRHALSLVPIPDTFAPEGEDEAHFIHVESAIRQTGPTL